MASNLPLHEESQSEVYSFSSRPRVVPSRPRFRKAAALQNEDEINYGNIMYDRRVVRGNTYAPSILPIPNPVEFLRQQESRRRASSKKRKERFGLKSPDAIDGRKNMCVQTDKYLEELGEIIVEVNVECQTDVFLDQPATPLFIPAKTGRDVATVIEDGDLFDFDMEVQPTLQVLVGKTIEQALLEVMEEEELASLRAQQQTFIQTQNAELVEVQRLEERERRIHVEKGNRIRQQKEVLEKEKETAEKFAARAFAQHYLSDLLPTVYSNLRECGYFYDPVERDIETGFLPALMEDVSSTLEQRRVARIVLDQLIEDVTGKRLAAFDQEE